MITLLPKKAKTAGTLLTLGLLLASSAFVVAWVLHDKVQAGSLVLVKDKQVAVAQASSVIHYQTELKQVNDRLNALQASLDDTSTAWTTRELLALTYLDRARLSGSIDDYRAADETIKQVFQQSSNQVGPYLTRATIHVALHRYKQAEDDLSKANNALIITDETQHKINGLLGDARLKTDLIGEAEILFKQLERNNPSMQSAARLAQLKLQLGDFAQADYWLDIADERIIARSAYHLAWLHLQRGIVDLEQSELAQALTHFNEANQKFPGYWLIEEHIAEVYTLTGRTQEAISLYRDIVERTQLPSMMAALANALEVLDDTELEQEINSWKSRSTSLFNAILVDYPELASGHAFVSLDASNPTLLPQ